VWTDVYDRRLTDALAVQADVATRIAIALASQISSRVPPDVSPARR
jgi:TolB-like protein